MKKKPTARVGWSRNSRRRSANYWRRISWPETAVSRRSRGAADEAPHARGDFQPDQHRMCRGSTRSTCSPARAPSDWKPKPRRRATATFIEKHVPSARMVEAEYSLAGRAKIGQRCCVTSAFLWAKRDLAKAAAEGHRLESRGCFLQPAVRVLPERQAEMLELISRIREHAPVASIMMVEADETFDFELLRGSRVERRVHGVGYSCPMPPAVVGVWRNRHARGL